MTGMLAQLAKPTPKRTMTRTPQKNLKKAEFELDAATSCREPACAVADS
jgi:hypothetical protein